MFKIWVADFDSPSYFVAIAAAELGYFKAEGIDIEFVYNRKDGPEMLRAGELHFVGGPAYAGTRAFPAWKGARLLCALSHNSYWFLAVRADLDVQRGDLQALKGLRISSSTFFPFAGLKYMLAEAGLDLERDKISIVPPPPSYGDKGFMARNGVDSIIDGTADAYWGNGMRLAVGESLGIAKLHLDLRRGDGPPGAKRYNFAALTTSERLIKEHPDVAAGAVRAIVQTQKALRADPKLAAIVGRKLFPADEAELIAPLIERDAPFYDPSISQDAIDGLMTFAVKAGIIREPVPFEDVVASEFRTLWSN